LYLKGRYGHFLRRFGSTIKTEASSRAVEALAFAVLLYEDFNRPAIYRAIERWVLFPFGMARSLGPMQVHTAEAFADAELIALGVRKLSRDFQTSLVEAMNANPVSATIRTRRNQETGMEVPYQPGDERTLSFEDLSWWQGQLVLSRTAAKYNVRSDYPGQVVAIFNVLAIQYYPEFTAGRMAPKAG